MNLFRPILLTCTLAAALLTGCGGGGASSSSAASSSPPPATHAAGIATPKSVSVVTAN